MCTENIRALSYIGAEKITFLPKSDRRTYSYRSNYRVASLLKKKRGIVGYLPGVPILQGIHNPFSSLNGSLNLNNIILKILG